MNAIENKVKVNSLLWFGVILFLTLSYPLQVITKSPLPSLIPYVFILMIVIPTILNSKVIRVHHRSNIGFMVFMYLLLLLLNTCWQFSFGVITYNEALSVLVIYLLPVIFYFYFRKVASEKEIKAILVAIVIAGLIVGIFFVYDSFLKLVVGHVSKYNKEAFLYLLERVNKAAGDVNNARIKLERAYGLLESHSVSGAYVALSTFAALTLIPKYRRGFRLFVLGVFGVMLLIGLNYTSIVAYAIIVFFYEFDGKDLIRYKLPPRLLRGLFVTLFIIIPALFIVVLMFGNSMVDKIIKYSAIQYSFLFHHDAGHRSFMVQALFNNISNSFIYITNHPITLFLGDGFSRNYGMIKGGDVGITESMTIFGPIFFMMILIGYFRLIKSGTRQMRILNANKIDGIKSMTRQSIIQFSICVTLLILICDLHYSIWKAKSILPFVFFTLALFERYDERTMVKTEQCQFPTEKEIPSGKHI
jgi:hypothetical protein